jgi:hypothetical protein
MLARARRRAAGRPKGQKVSARQFAFLAFLAWGATLALLDWSFGALRQPDEQAMVQPIGNPEAPPPALLPEPDPEPKSATVSVPGDTPAARSDRPWWMPGWMGDDDDEAAPGVPEREEAIAGEAAA